MSKIMINFFLNTLRKTFAAFISNKLSNYDKNIELYL